MLHSKTNKQIKKQIKKRKKERKERKIEKDEMNGVKNNTQHNRQRVYLSTVCCCNIFFEMVESWELGSLNLAISEDNIEKVKKILNERPEFLNFQDPGNVKQFFLSFFLFFSPLISSFTIYFLEKAHSFVSSSNEQKNEMY